MQRTWWRRPEGGVTCAPEDPAALADAVLKLYRMSPGQRAEMGAMGRQALLQRYSREVLVRRHEELLSRVAGRTEPVKGSQGV